MNKETTGQNWITVEAPGYLGKKKDAYLVHLNETYGEGKWRFAWELENGEAWNFDDIFWKGYVASYAKYLWEQPSEADYLSQNYAYTYDKDLVTREQAFDPHYLYDKPGRVNQFHNVALNIALEWFVAKPFRGEVPLQVREGKPGSPETEWPAGWKWSPGRIPFAREAALIPLTDMPRWWHRGTIEELYQAAKVVQIQH